MSEAKKGYTSSTVCLDGENSHDWRDDVMMEEGIAFEIRRCVICGYYY